jgi:hypothetical protein
MPLKPARREGVLLLADARIAKTQQRVKYATVLYFDNRSAA